MQLKNVFNRYTFLILLPILSYLILMTWFKNYSFPTAKSNEIRYKSVFLDSPVRMQKIFGTESTFFEIEAGRMKFGPVFISFWATWCDPCKREFELLDPFIERESIQKLGVKFWAVAIDDDFDSVLASKRSYKSQFLLFFDPLRRFAKYFKVDGLPTSYLVSREGDIVWMKEGEMKEYDLSTLEKKIREIY